MPDAAIDELMAKLQKQFRSASGVKMVAIMVLAGADNMVAVGFIPDVSSVPAAGGQMMADPLSKKQTKTTRSVSSSVLFGLEELLLYSATHASFVWRCQFDLVP